MIDNTTKDLRHRFVAELRDADQVEMTQET